MATAMSGMDDQGWARASRRRVGSWFGLAAAVVLLLATACVPIRERVAAPQAAPHTAPKEAARAARHMVTAANPLAARAGLDILRAGGSAVDAAIATQMVLNLVEPHSSGIGGGGFMIHFTASTGEITAYDGRETAPASATPGMFLDDNGSPRRLYDAVVGGLSVGVPGLLRMLEIAHRDHGRLEWANLFEPAIELAEKGFAVSPHLHESIAGAKRLKTFAPATAYFHTAGGDAKPAGTVLANKSLAETFRTIATEGADAFYEGPVAEDIVDVVRGAALNPSGMTADDLATYQAKKRAPICLAYRLWLICGMPPPTSGGITTLQILGILQGFDLMAMKPGSAGAVHVVAEASRLAFADRNAFVADADFLPVPVAGLLDPGYLKRRAAAISPLRTMGKAAAGTPSRNTGLGPAPSADDEHGVSTSHVSIIDGDGNALAMTSSIESAFGSAAHGAWLRAQQPARRFLVQAPGRRPAGGQPRGARKAPPQLDVAEPGLRRQRPGRDGGGIAGRIAPSSATWRRPSSRRWTGASISKRPSRFPHFVNRNGATDLEKGTPLEALKPALEVLGHDVRIRALDSDLLSVMVTPDGLVGGADPRREGVALGTSRNAGNWLDLLDCRIKPARSGKQALESVYGCRVLRRQYDRLEEFDRRPHDRRTPSRRLPFAGARPAHPRRPPVGLFQRGPHG